VKFEPHTGGRVYLKKIYHHKPALQLRTNILISRSIPCPILSKMRLEDRVRINQNVFIKSNKNNLKIAYYL